MLKKVYLVTGSTGALGQEIVSLWTAKNTLFILIGRNKEKLLEQKKDLEAKGAQCRVELCDLTNRESLQQICTQLVQDQIIPDMIFNCAGAGLKSLAHLGSLEVQLNMVRLNAEALTHISLFFIPHMIHRTTGTIVNISSSGAFQPSPGVAVYAATKAYVNSLSQALDYECTGTGVKVITVCPGAFINESEYAEFIKKPGLFRKQRTFTTQQMALFIKHGIEKNKSLIIPGRVNRLLAFFSRHLGIKIIMYLVPFFFKGERLKN